MIATSAKTLTLGVALLLSAAGARAQTADPPPTVTFTGINDAVPGRFFDAATSAPEPTDPNTLVIGLHTGTDPTTWKDRDFKASMLPFSYPSAADTISFTIHAPAGYYVATVTYHETLVLGDSRTGRSFASTQMVVNGIALQEPFIDISA